MVERLIIPFTGQQLIRTLSYRHQQPISDIVDGEFTLASPMTVTAGVEYFLTFDPLQLARNFENGMNVNSGISTLFDFDNNVTNWSEFEDTPMMVIEPNVIYKPNAANAGNCIIRIYANETSLIQFNQAIIDFKGGVFEKMSTLFSIYAGDETGFDIKNKGVKCSFEFSLDGLMHSMALKQYLT